MNLCYYINCSIYCKLSHSYWTWKVDLLANPKLCFAQGGILKKIKLEFLKFEKLPTWPRCKTGFNLIAYPLHCRGHFITGTLHRRDTSSQVHFIAGTLHRRYTSSQGHFIAGTLHRRYTSSQGHFIAGTLHRRYTSSQGHFIAGTLHRRDTSSQGHFIAGTLHRRDTSSQVHYIAGYTSSQGVFHHTLSSSLNLSLWILFISIRFHF